MRLYTERAINEMLEQYSDNIDVEMFEGVLLDNYIVKFYGNFKYKYLIIEEYSQNEWSSAYKIYKTNKEDKVERYSKIFKAEVN